MKPDPLFLGAGIVVALWAAFLLFTNLIGKRLPFLWAPGLLWALLSAGLLVQGFAPHLEIQNGGFVLPLNLINGSHGIDPEDLVAREKRMQLLSAFVTTIAAIGLAIYYGRPYFQAQSKAAG